MGSNRRTPFRTLAISYITLELKGLKVLRGCLHSPALQTHREQGLGQLSQRNRQGYWERGTGMGSRRGVPVNHTCAGGMPHATQSRCGLLYTPLPVPPTSSLSTPSLSIELDHHGLLRLPFNACHECTSGAGRLPDPGLLRIRFFEDKYI